MSNVVSMHQSELLKPLRVGNIVLKNRLFIAAHSYCYPEDKMLAYILERAKGGVSLLIMGETFVSDRFIAETYGASISKDTIVSFYNKVSEETNRHNMHVFDQLFHPGGQAWIDEGVMAFAPSPVPQMISQLTPSVLTKTMIEDLIEDFGKAAKRCKDGGLSGVELKADQGKLHEQFMSPCFNRREDDYGLGFEGRMKFVLDTLREMRRNIGSDFALGIRIAGDTLDQAEHGITSTHIDHEIALNISQRLANSGLVDYINVNGATNATFVGYWKNHGDETVNRANFASMAKSIKRSVNIPVFVASMILHVDDALDVIQSESADMVAMVRAHIADPQIVEKIQKNEIEDIRPCIACNQSCVGNSFKGKEIKCIHNPMAGREQFFNSMPLKRSVVPKRIVVIGGGVAGLEAAKTLGHRGYNVSLIEKSSRLGGQVLIASKAANRNRIAEIALYLSNQLMKLPNVSIETEYDLSSKGIVDLNPDAIVIAIGSLPTLPDIPGIQSANAFTISQILEKDLSKVKGHFVIVDIDWRLHALSLAETMIDAGIDVTIVTPYGFSGAAPYPLGGLNIVSLTSYYRRLLRKKLNVITFSQVTLLKSSDVHIRNIFTYEDSVIPQVDGIVFVVNQQPNRSLEEELRVLVPNRKVVAVGDCVYPRGIEYAILDGHIAGRTL